jgi:hypothetical protein
VSRWHCRCATVLLHCGCGCDLQLGPAVFCCRLLDVLAFSLAHHARVAVEQAATALTTVSWTRKS